MFGQQLRRGDWAFGQRVVVIGVDGVLGVGQDCEKADGGGVAICGLRKSLQDTSLFCNIPRHF